jgi:hypothetical protein
MQGDLLLCCLRAVTHILNFYVIQCEGVTEV